MFDPASRYATVPAATLTVTDGNGVRQVRYVKRRIIPPTGGMTLVEHTVVQGERLDGITARYTANPTQFWSLCDANNVFVPEELEEPGRIVLIAIRGM